MRADAAQRQAFFIHRAGWQRVDDVQFSADALVRLHLSVQIKRDGGLRQIGPKTAGVDAACLQRNFAHSERVKRRKDHIAAAACALRVKVGFDRQRFQVAAQHRLRLTCIAPGSAQKIELAAEQKRRPGRQCQCCIQIAPRGDDGGILQLPLLASAIERETQIAHFGARTGLGNHHQLLQLRSLDFDLERHRELGREQQRIVRFFQCLQRQARRLQLFNPDMAAQQLRRRPAQIEIIQREHLLGRAVHQLIDMYRPQQRTAHAGKRQRTVAALGRLLQGPAQAGFARNQDRRQQHNAKQQR